MNAVSDVRRAQAVDAALAVLDDAVFKALQEPSRIAVLRQLILLGRSDIAGIAERLPQERSVVSRHLQVLLEAGVVRVERVGRHRIYEVDGPAVLAKFERILRQFALLVPFCCPANGGLASNG